MRRPTLRAAFALVVVSGLGSCQLGSGDNTLAPSPAQTTSANGPLEISAESGEIGVNRPRGAGASWTANFAVPICLVDPSSTPVTLTSVSYALGSGDGRIESYVRTVAKSDLNDDSDGFLSSTGDLEDALRPYGGDLSRVNGTKIDIACDRQGEDGYAELITSIEVGIAGMAVRGLDLRYEARGRVYVARSAFGYAACGSAQDPEFCP